MKKKLWIVALLWLGINSFFLVRWVRAHYIVPVLMYHEIDARDTQGSKLVVSPESFRRQMEFLKLTGAKVTPMEEVVEAFHSGDSLHSRTVVLTFDDGFENFYTNAFPTLQTHHLPAVVFVVTGWVGKNGYLTWEQIRQLDQEGITIGSHSVTHPWLPALSDVELKRELQASKRILEGKLGHPVDLFCYPMGAFDERVRKAVIDAGYRGARATNPGKAASNRDPYALKRVRISRSSDSLLTFWVESSGYYLGFKEK